MKRKNLHMSYMILPSPLQIRFFLQIVISYNLAKRVFKRRRWFVVIRIKKDAVFSTVEMSSVIMITTRYRKYSRRRRWSIIIVSKKGKWSNMSTIPSIWRRSCVIITSTMCVFFAISRITLTCLYHRWRSWRTSTPWRTHYFVPAVCIGHWSRCTIGRSWFPVHIRSVSCHSIMTISMAIAISTSRFTKWY